MSLCCWFISIAIVVGYNRIWERICWKSWCCDLCRGWLKSGWVSCINRSNYCGSWWCWEGVRWTASTRLLLLLLLLVWYWHEFLLLLLLRLLWVNSMIDFRFLKIIPPCRCCGLWLWLIVCFTLRGWWWRLWSIILNVSNNITTTTLSENICQPLS